MPQPHKIQAQREKAQHLVALKESPSYPILRDIVQADIQKEFKKFIATPGVTQQGLDYARGMMFGMQKVLDIIERGEREFERAVAAAQALQEEGVN